MKELYSHNDKKEFQLKVKPYRPYVTKDEGLAIALFYIGYELISTNRDDRDVTSFLFRRDSLIKEAEREYYTDALSVGARSFFDTVKMLQNRLCSE